MLDQKVINVSHVLKRLNGCCSLNQLMKALKTFKDARPRHARATASVCHGNARLYCLLVHIHLQII